MSQLLLRLQQAALLAGSTSSLLPAAATAASSICGIWTSAFWQQQPQLREQLQHAQLQQPHQLLHNILQQQQQQPCAGFSTCTAAADVAVLRLNTPSQQLPCLLQTSRPSRQQLGNANTVKYPYPLPPAYTSRRWQLRSLEGKPIGAVELPGDIFNVPVRIDILHQVVRWQRAKARQGTHKTKDRSEVSGGGKKPWQQKGSGRARQGSIRAPQWRGGGIVHGPVPRSYAFDLPKKVRRLGLKCALSAKVNEGRLILLDSLVPPVPKTKVMAGKLQSLLNTQAAAGGKAAANFLPDPLESGLSTLVQQHKAAATADNQQQQLLPQQEKQQQEEGEGDIADILLQTPESEEAVVEVVQQTQQQKQKRVPRLNAVLIDSAKDGEDGGELMRRAVRNLPGVEVVPARGANVLSLLRRDYLIVTKPGLDALIERLQRPINRLGAAGLAFRLKLQQRRAAQARQKRIQQIWTPAKQQRLATA